MIGRVPKARVRSVSWLTSCELHVSSSAGTDFSSLFFCVSRLHREDSHLSRLHKIRPTAVFTTWARTKGASSRWSLHWEIPFVTWTCRSVDIRAVLRSRSPVQCWKWADRISWSQRLFPMTATHHMKRRFAHSYPVQYPRSWTVHCSSSIFHWKRCYKAYIAAVRLFWEQVLNDPSRFVTWRLLASGPKLLVQAQGLYLYCCTNMNLYLYSCTNIDPFVKLWVFSIGSATQKKIVNKQSRIILRVIFDFLWISWLDESKASPIRFHKKSKHNCSSKTGSVSFGWFFVRGEPKLEIFCKLFCFLQVGFWSSHPIPNPAVWSQCTAASPHVRVSMESMAIIGQFS